MLLISGTACFKASICFSPLFSTTVLRRVMHSVHRVLGIYPSVKRCAVLCEKFVCLSLVTLHQSCRFSASGANRFPLASPPKHEQACKIERTFKNNPLCAFESWWFKFKLCGKIKGIQNYI